MTPPLDFSGTRPEAVRVTTLANGLRVATDSMATVETVSIGAFVEVGTRNEARQVNGVSHMLEHMAFKGTERRSAQKIAEEIEAVGGHLNAYTAREHTAYYAKALKEDWRLALDILADILQHSVLDADELERERAVIVQEIHQANDTPDDIIFDYFQETAFPDQAIGRPVLGSAEVVGGLGRETVLRYMREHYSAPRIVLAAAGRLDHDALVEAAERAFTGLPSPECSDVEPARYAGGDFRAARELEQVHALLGFQGVTYTDEDFYAASVYATLLGGGMSSRLFQEAREKRGLCYSIYAYLSPYIDGGLFGIYAGTGEKEVAELIPLVCHELAKVVGDAAEDEVARARAQLKASILMSLESTSARCEQLARQLAVYGRPLAVAEMVAKIEAVDETAVRRFAGRLLGSRPTVAAIGPIGRLEAYEKTAERLKVRKDGEAGTEGKTRSGNAVPSSHA